MPEVFNSLSMFVFMVTAILQTPCAYGSGVAQKHYTIPLFRPSATTGASANPGIITVETAVRSDQSVVYQAQYTIDQLGRRLVPTIRQESQEPQFAIFMGGSAAFGQGVSDGETIPSLVNQSLPFLSPYNYSLPGWGLGSVYAMTEETQFHLQVNEKTGYVFYIFPTFHIDRLVGGLQTISWSGPLPYYYLDDGIVIRRGFIQSERPYYTRAIKWFLTSIFHQKLGWNWPFDVTNDDIELACLMLEQMKDKLGSHFKKTHFTVVIHPHSTSIDPTSCLTARGVDYLDLRKLFLGHDWTQLIIMDDGHVNGAGNKLISNEIVNYLKNHAIVR